MPIMRISTFIASPPYNFIKIDFIFIKNSFKKMNCVYKFSCKDPGVKEFYIGYTKNLNRRIITHRNTYKNEKIKWYKFVKDNGGFDNWVFNIIEEDCEKIRERYWIEELKAELNSVIPGRTQKEYVQTEKAKQYIAKSQAKYQSSQKGKIAIAKRGSKKVECPHCKIIMNKSSISRHKKKYCKKI
jgi:hypothetical protein